jgi:hypothetical protein
MNLRAAAAGAIVLGTLGGRAALASPSEEDPLVRPSGGDAAASIEEGAFLPTTLRARHGNEKATVLVLSGYDGAHDAPSLELSTELHLWGPLSVVGGAVYSDHGDVLRPTVGVVWQAARRERLGVDLALGLAYRPEGFTEPEGEVEATVAVGRRFGRLTGLVNLTYGQDPEGNERDAEAKLAVVAPVARTLLVGFDSRLRLGLARPAEGPEAHVEYDGIAGPIAYWALGSWTLMGQAGASVLGRDTGAEVGASVLVGLGVSVD